MRDDLLNPENSEEDRSQSELLRPQKLSDFTGQEEIKTRLEIMLAAAQKRKQPLDHLLFAGPPGLGKTTLSRIVSNELGGNLHMTSGPILERSGDLAAILTRLEEGDVLFIDEIHRLARPVEEILYPAMEEFRVDVILGKGPAARSISLDIAPFTLVAATTRTALITSPLRDRFGLAERLDYYTSQDLEKIIERAAQIMKTEITPEAGYEIARRARGTPRIANRLLRRVRDFLETREGKTKLDADTASEGLSAFGVDDMGLDNVDIAILSSICGNFSGGPVGLSTLSIAVGEPTDTVEDVYEPFLIQQGLVMRTPRGRVCTAAAWKHLGLDPPDDIQSRLNL